MNKAFVKESDDEPLSILPEMPSDVRNYITRAGYQSMQIELRHLLESLRVAAGSSTNKQDGDLTKMPTETQVREIEQRIHYLQSRLDTAEIVDPSVHVNEDQIFFGATVKYQNEQGEPYTVTIVGLDEIDPSNGKISWLSPVAQALLNAYAGDSVMLQTPAGDEELDILTVLYPNKVEPDVAGTGLTNKSSE